MRRESGSEGCVVHKVRGTTLIHATACPFGINGFFLSGNGSLRGHKSPNEVRPGSLRVGAG